MQEEKPRKNRVKRLEVIAIEAILKQFPIVHNPYFFIYEFDLPKDLENSLWFVRELIWAVEARMILDRGLPATCNHKRYNFYHEIMKNDK